MSLSDKSFIHNKSRGVGKGQLKRKAYREEVVKEAVKELKEEIEVTKKGYVRLSEPQILRLIDEIFGEALI